MLDEGQNEAAPRAFRALIAHPHRGDGRAEDASYLRVLALDRSGDETGERDAARDYLQRYPSGFRRPEIEKGLREIPEGGPR